MTTEADLKNGQAAAWAELWAEFVRLGVVDWVPVYGTDIQPCGKEWAKAFVRYLAECRDRLELAREALVATGYFTRNEVGLDVALCITELVGMAQTAPIVPREYQ